MLHERMSANRWYNATIQELFAETCQDRPEKTAIIYKDQALTFSEIQRNVNQLSQAMVDLGVKPGDHVAMLPTSCPEFTYVYFATLQIGALINPLNLLWGEIEFTGILQRNNPKVIFTIDENAGKDYIGLLKTSIPDLRFEGESASSSVITNLTHMVSLSRSGAQHDGFIDFNDLLDRGAGCNQDVINGLIAKSRCTDIQFMCQTSGSTGLSKSGLWNHRPPLSTAHFMAHKMVYSEEDVYLNMTPYYHNSGIAAMNLTLAYTGSTLLLMENFHPKTAVEMMQKYEPTSTFGFDAHFQALKLVLKAGSFKFTLTKVIAALTPATYEMIVNEWLSGRGATISSLYAQTENGPLVTLMEPGCMNHEIRKNTQGRPLPGVELAIKDLASGERLPDGRQGEICYKSPYLFSGYYKQEDETRKLFDEEGFLHSGDFGFIDGGYLTFLGRLGGVVKSGGENVSTTYVSNLLMKILPDEFEDVLTVGVPDPYWGSKIISLVRLKQGKTLRPSDELRKDCKGQMADYEIPKDFIVWEGLWPMTEIGKVNMSILEKVAAERSGGIAPAVN